MNDLTATRTQLRDELAGVLTDIEVHVTVPDHASAPMVFVSPGSPYTTVEGANFGGRIVHMNVIPVASPGTNDQAAEDLDDLILQVLDALEPSEVFVAGDVDLPGQVSINGQSHLACSIEVTTEIRR